MLALLPAPVEAGPQIPRASQPQPGIVSPDAAIRRLLAASADLAVSDGRTEWGIVDFLESVAGDEDASAALASLGVDVDAMREAIKRRATGEELAG